MKKARKLETELIGALKRGTNTARDLRQRLGCSQPTLSRALSKLKSLLVVIGRGPGTKYALRREVAGVGAELAIFEANRKGKRKLLGRLCFINPNGCVLFRDSERELVFEDLPYFLNDLRPSGFLGRVVPTLYPELNAPTEISLWSADDVYRYLEFLGDDLIGNLVIGERAFNRSLLDAPSHAQSNDFRTIGERYEALADDVLRIRSGGSSVGGEQPKFLTLDTESGSALLVKFTPPISNEIGQRRSDLLICESIAHTAMKKMNFAAVESKIIQTARRTFLECRRFDRIAGGGRLGLISMESLNLEFVGGRGSWTETAGELLRLGIIDQEALDQIRRVHLFGALIANSDMHLGNISFLFEEFKVLGLAPIYDMLPMWYAPQSENILERDYSFPTPTVSDRDIWPECWESACHFWSEVASDIRVSLGFRDIAKKNRTKLLQLEAAIQKLREV